MAWVRRLVNLLRSNKVARDIEREVAFHIREREDELRECGMGPVEAARLARIQFGSVTAHKERTRERELNLILFVKVEGRL